jgi:alkylation response protein AidB-like acyl-CoA dehydrogenase
MDDDVLEIVASISDFFERRGDAAAIAQASATGSPADTSRWRALCELGLPVMRLPEPEGVGVGLLESTVLAERIGAVLVPEPAVSTMVLADAWASHPEGQKLLSSLCSGERITSCNGFDGGFLSPAGELGGRVTVAADGVVDSVALLAADRYTAGSALVIVDLKSFAGSLDPSGLDPTRPTAVVDLVGVEPADVLRLSSDAADRIRRELAILAAAELVGGMQHVLEETVAFVTTREQFGRAIGGFQAVKHTLADMYTRTEQARAIVQFAAIECTSGAESAQSTTNSVARWVPRSAISVCEDALHLHGAMGYSWEVDVHLHLRRALAVKSALDLFDRRPLDSSVPEAEAV